MRSLRYRPEIDGLRAVAVMAVVLFHTRIRFSGGYVGVDIFFVISGFLITSLILSDVRSGTFTFAGFWERRIRRIVPAAAATVLVSLPVGYFVLLPSDFAELGRSAIAQAVLAANVFFFSETGYFSSPAGNKPLLHFWSLAVEEQFYLVLPFVVVGVFRRWGTRAVTYVVGAVALGSFGLSVVGVERFPGATFYLLPTRAWELCLGALLALTSCQLPIPERLRGTAGWAGMALMGLPMLLYEKSTAFPGLAALPPCLGAVLVIWSTNRGEGLLKQALTLRPVVWIGLISYSLYLWHWPLQVYSNYWLTTNPSPWWLRLSVFGGSILLAWLSYRYIETPFRTRRWAPRRRTVALGALGAFGATVAAGALIAGFDGLPNRFPPQTTEYASAYHDRPTVDTADVSAERVATDDLPELSAVDQGVNAVLLWGDSHARVVSPALEAACAELGIRGRRASRSSTTPLLNYGNAEAREFNLAVLSWIIAHRPRVVLLVSRWEAHLKNPDRLEPLLATIDAISKHGVSVALMRQVPFQGQDVPKALARAHAFGESEGAVGISIDANARTLLAANSVIDRAKALRPHLQVLDPLPYLSDDGICFAGRRGRALYYDEQHLTRFGASFLVPLFEPLLSRGLPASGLAQGAQRLLAEQVTPGTN